MTKHFIGISTLCAIALSAAPAMAADPDTRSETVSYADLDLTTEAGVDELEHRIDFAARRVCGFSEPDTGSRIRSTETRACHVQATRSFEIRFAQIIREARERAEV